MGTPVPGLGLRPAPLDHLSPVRPPWRRCWGACGRPPPRALPLGGDGLSNGPHLCGHLDAPLQAAAPAPVRLVLGNHDFYGGPLAALRFAVGGLAAARAGRLILLDGMAPQDLGEGV